MYFEHWLPLEEVRMDSQDQKWKWMVNFLPKYIVSKELGMGIPGIWILFYLWPRPAKKCDRGIEI